MKKLTKLSTLVLAATLGLTACGGNKAGTDSKYSTLIVDSAPFSGDFFTADFGNSAYDRSVIDLIHATATFSITDTGKYVLNEGIVEKDGFKKETDAEGNTVGVFKLRKDLKWSDGKPVTAHDFVFGQLLTYSKEWSDLGAQVSIDTAYPNGNAYVKGETKSLKPFKLIDDYTFSVTVLKDALPYFYELQYFTVGALPLHELGLGGKVVSTDEGVKFEGDMKKVAENAKVTQVDSKKPTVTYGKYVLDKVSETEVVLKLNPNYVGNYEGVKPSIKEIVIKTNKQLDLEVQRLKTGEVDLVSGVIEAEKLKQVANDPKFGANKYERNGYGYLGFANDYGPTADVNVRRALGHLTNRGQLITTVLGGSGVVVNGEYALAQWMSKENKDALAKFNSYAYDVNLANDELDKSAYRFEADGTTPFDKSKASAEYIRYNSNKEPLEVRHLGTENNPITVTLQSNFQQDAPKVGLKYSVETSDFPTLQKAISNTATASSEQKYHLYNLATTFAVVYDPYLNSYHTRNVGQANRNAYRVSNPVMDKAAEAMRKVDSKDLATFSKHWLEYQTEFNNTLPLLPLYSNIYSDLYNAEKIDVISSGSIRSWSQSIEYSKLK